MFKKVIHKRNGRWYFWNETWKVRIGPYSSKSDTIKALIKYAKKLVSKDLSSS